MTTTAPERDTLTPSAPEREQLAKIGHLLQRAPAEVPHLVVGEERVEVPAPLVRVMVQWLRSVERGEPATLVSVDRLLTTQQAADLLGVSRQYFVQLLERGDIPFKKTGTHRRVRAGDLLAYKQRWDAERRAALKRLVELSEELGLYESTLTLPARWRRIDPSTGEFVKTGRGTRRRAAPKTRLDAADGATR